MYHLVQRQGFGSVNTRMLARMLAGGVLLGAMASCSSSGTGSKPLSQAELEQKQQAETKKLAAAKPESNDPLQRWMNAQEQLNNSKDGGGDVRALPKPIPRPGAAEPATPAKATKGGEGTLANAPVELDPAEAAHAPTDEPQHTSGKVSMKAGKDGSDAASSRDALRKEAMQSSAPMGAFIRLAAADMIDDGGKPLTGDAAAKMDAAFSRLTPAERDFVAAWRELHEGVAKGVDASGDMGQLTKAASVFARKAHAWEPLRISKASLCTKVEGFGVYSELTRYGDVYKFIAGRKQKFIVYSELERFTPAPVAKNGMQGYSVELNQDLTLFHAGKDKDVTAWRRDGQVISDFSRNPRHDFFVVQIIELPETLSIGGYTLKVSVSDRNAGATSGSSGSATAEAVIPIEIVADASAMRE